MIEEAFLYTNQEIGSFAIYVEGIDENEDLEWLAFDLFDVDEQRIFNDRLWSRFSHIIFDNGRFKAWFIYINAEISNAVSSGIAIVTDEVGNQSEPYSFERAAPEAATDFCDPHRTINFCESGLCNDFVCVEEPEAACPAGWEVIDLNAQEDWSHQGSTEGSETYTNGGSCGGGSPQNIFSFTALEAGEYLFTTSTAGDDDTLIYLRDHCAIEDVEAELACNDDYRENSYTSQINVSLEAGQSVFLFVDGYNGSEGPWSGGYSLEVEASSPPSIEELEAYLSDESPDQLLAVRGSGFDPNDDVEYFRLNLLDESGAPIAEEALEASFAGADHADLQSDGGGNYHFVILEMIQDPSIVQVQLQLGDGSGLWSESMAVEIEPAPIVAPGEACQLGFIRCEGETRCLPSTDLPEGEELTEFSCQIPPPDPVPVLEEALLYRDLESGFFTIYIEGRDGDEDLNSMRFQFFNAEGMEMLRTPLQFELSHVIFEEGVFKAWFQSLSFDIANEAVAGFVIAIDAEGNQSESVDLQNATAEAATDFCDPSRIINFCELGLCHNFLCVEDLEPGCPTGWEVLDLNAQEGWSYEGSTLGSEIYAEGGSCGGGSSQNVFSFTAPSTGDYIFTTTIEDEDDTVLYIRDYCEVADFNAEIACNDDYSQTHYSSRLNIHLEAEQSVFVFVDGYKSSENAWSGSYRLDAILSSPPTLDRLEVYQNGEVPEMELAIRGSGSDLEGDTDRVRMNFLDENGALIQEFTESLFSELEFADLILNEDGSYSFTIQGNIDFEFAEVGISIGDSSGAWSEMVTAAVEAPPVIALGEACEFGFNHCEGEGVCAPPLDLSRGEELFCRLLHSPILNDAELYHRDADEEGDREWVLWFTGTDEDNNTNGIQISLIDEQGEALTILNGSTEVITNFLLLDETEESFTGLLYIQPSERVASIHLALLDDDGGLSEFVDISIADAIEGVESAEGERCDPHGVMASCTGEIYCVEGICAAEAPCPESWVIVDLNAEAVDGEVIGSSLGSEVFPYSSCGRDTGAAVFSFTADEEGTYTFSTDYEYLYCSGPESDECGEGVECNAHLPMPESPACRVDADCGEGAACILEEAGNFCALYICGELIDTLIFARSLCNSEDFRTELACNDDTNGPLSEISLLLDAAQTIYLFVEGYDSQIDFILRYAQDVIP